MVVAKGNGRRCRPMADSGVLTRDLHTMPCGTTVQCVDHLAGHRIGAGIPGGLADHGIRPDVFQSRGATKMPNKNGYLSHDMQSKITVKLFISTCLGSMPQGSAVRDEEGIALAPGFQRVANTSATRCKRHLSSERRLWKTTESPPRPGAGLPDHRVSGQKLIEANRMVVPASNKGASCPVGAPARRTF